MQKSVSTHVFAGVVFLEADGFLYLKQLRPYYVAGKRFGLKPCSPALTVNMAAVNYAIARGLRIRIIINNKVYEAPQHLHGRYYVNRKGVELIAIPWKAFRRVYDVPANVAEYFGLKPGDSNG